MKKTIKKFLTILFSIICCFTIIGCGSGDNTNKIASLTYKTLDGEKVTAYSYYVYKIDRIEMCTQNGKFLKDVTDETYVSKCVSKNKSTCIRSDKIPSGVDNVERKAATNWGYYTYSSEFDCSVYFYIYTLEVEKNYDIETNNKNGMITIKYPYLSSPLDEPYCYQSLAVKEKSITISQENVTINYS